MLKKIGNSPVLLSVLMIVLGIALVVWRNPVVEVVLTAVGIVLLIGSIISIIGWYRNRYTGWDGYTSLGGGILGVVAGIVVLSNPTGIASLFPVVMGFIILLTGIVNTGKALDLKKIGYPRWSTMFLLAVVTIIIGMIFITNPLSVLSAPILMAGLGLIYDGITSLMIVTRKD